jgi:hypothetical protein
MPDIVKQVSSRAVIITAQHNGLILTFGPASTSSLVGTFIMQFNPDVDSDFSAVVMGRCWGQFAKDRGVPFMPIPYRIASLGNVAKDYAIVSDTITKPALIQIPANWEVGLLVAVTRGACSVCSWNLPGSSAP